MRCREHNWFLGPNGRTLRQESVNCGWVWEPDLEKRGRKQGRIWMGVSEVSVMGTQSRRHMLIVLGENWKTARIRKRHESRDGPPWQQEEHYKREEETWATATLMCDAFHGEDAAGGPGQMTSNCWHCVLRLFSLQTNTTLFFLHLLVSVTLCSQQRADKNAGIRSTQI